MIYRITDGIQSVILFLCAMNSPLKFLQYTVYHNSLYDWLVALGIIIISVVAARIIFWLISKVLHQYAKQTETSIDDLIIKRIDTPVALGIVLIGFRLAIEQLTFSRPVENYLQRGFVFMSALTITWFITRVFRALIEYYFRNNKEHENNRLDEQMLQVSKRAVVFVLWPLGIVVGLNNAGFDVGALIAGLGIGGLAIALAAQDTVKNIIGGLIVFMDKPFRFGDVVKVKDIEGTVVYTGIRSTRIRTGAGRLVTIPNAQFTDSAIENITVEPAKRIVTYLSLPYETTSDKIDEAILILQNIIEESPDVNHYDSIVFLEKFSASSIEINFTYFIKKQSDVHTTQTAINKAVLQKFKQAGIEFAYPTQKVVQKK
ncbi:MAG: mechanosensitive ion channel family protein [Chitinophagales bacterium]